MTTGEYNRAVDEYADPVYRFILGNIKDEHRADDIVQDSYEKLWMHVTEIEFVCAKKWLFSTAYNTMIDIIRKEKRLSGLEDISNDTLIYNSGYSDLNEILHAALEKLPAIQKTCVLLRDYEGYSYKEIGEITGQTEANVKITIYRGRIALKNYIGSIESILESR
ncbi:MAG TPA: RNA polymerase sigma factor [Bacteroidales bacterium]|nr:RNA polymerase sigma factor [Bacteroidales bacterium]